MQSHLSTIEHYKTVRDVTGPAATNLEEYFLDLCAGDEL
jgi:hypothetical protein